MSSPESPPVLEPSWRTAFGLAAVTTGYLVALVGIAVYAWAEIHAIAFVPTLAVSVVGFLVMVAGGGLVWRERA
ncbi:hypothetical protein [Halococcus salsus]|nr:hypothetical protein [Halococcus salsus]RJT05289.1 hypothetical protein D3261_07880 [Halococcus sp. IIIV-5B]